MSGKTGIGYPKQIPVVSLVFTLYANTLRKGIHTSLLSKLSLKEKARLADNGKRN